MAGVPNCLMFVRVDAISTVKSSIPSMIYRWMGSYIQSAEVTETTKNVPK
jgi:hypothetical protein